MSDNSEMFKILDDIVERMMMSVIKHHLESCNATQKDLDDILALDSKEAWIVMSLLYGEPEGPGKLPNDID